MLISIERFWEAIDFCIEAHTNHSRRNNTRLWDGETPYAVHPIWCAMAFLQETKLRTRKKAREDYFFALMFHDILEDTTVGLPIWLSPESVLLIEQMTFSGEVGSTEIEIREIWSMPPVVRLLKLYDKVSNLLDGAWMPDEKWNEQYVPYVLRLATDVENAYGDLNIVRMSRAVAIKRSASKTTRAQAQKKGSDL